MVQGIKKTRVLPATTRSFPARRPLLLMWMFLTGTALMSIAVAQDPVLIRSGDITVSRSDLKRRLELMPTEFHRGGSVSDASKLEAALSLLAEAVLARESRSRGVDTSAAFRADFQRIRTMIARDQLYKAEISSRVSISAQELAAGMRDASRQLVCVFVYLENQEDAAFLRQRVRTAADLLSLTIDPTIKHFKDTVTVRWGEAEPAIEDALFGSRVGSVAPIVNMGGGAYLMGVLSSAPNVDFESRTVTWQREAVSDRLRERKEWGLFTAFTDSVLSEIVGQLRPDVLRRLVESVERTIVWRDDSASHLSGEDFRNVIQEDRNGFRDTLLSSTWAIVTAEDALFSMATEGAVWYRHQTIRNAVALREYVSVMLWRRKLAQDAEKKGLLSTPDARLRLDEWERAYLASTAEQVLMQDVQISESDVFRKLVAQGRFPSIPRVRIREAVLRTHTEAEQVLRDVKQGGDLTTVARTKSQSPSSQKGGMTGFFSIEDRYPLGAIAWTLDVGELGPPVQLGDAWIVFRLEEKEPILTEEQRSEVSATRIELQRTDAARRRSENIADAVRREGITVDVDGILDTEISPIPMATFRKLGFGGRMFEVPFLRKHTQWVKLLDQLRNVLP